MRRSVIKARLFPRAESVVRGGHPWVFDESIKSLSHDGEAGDMVAIYNRNDRLLALGFYDPGSPIRIRIVHAGGAAKLDEDWWRQLIQAAVHLRKGLLSMQTNGLRWIHGENDGFPGMVADQYADTLVVKLYSSIWLRRWEEMETLLRDELKPRFVVLRLSRNIMAHAEEVGLTEGFCGEPGPPVVVFREHGIRFEADVLRGQKTGFFLDQRENRQRVREMAQGKKVLNLFSYSGGFSLHAASGGAKRVVDVDISEHALESAKRNFALNGNLTSVHHESLQADVFDWLRNSGETFDLVINDPPSLAKRERERSTAIRAYRKLNEGAIRRVGERGTLLAASCSAHVTEHEFFTAVRQAARDSGRPHREQWTKTHAIDHPANFPEANYLKAICMEFP